MIVLFSFLPEVPILSSKTTLNAIWGMFSLFLSFVDSFLNHLGGCIHKDGWVKRKIPSTSLQRGTANQSALFPLNSLLNGVIKRPVASWTCSGTRSFWDVLWSWCSSGTYAIFWSDFEIATTVLFKYNKIGMFCLSGRKYVTAPNSF